MVCPIETWPSPARATRPLWRTQATVAAWNASFVGAITLVRPRMRGIVDLHQVFRAHVGVALRRAEAAVAQQLLDEAQVRALAQHVRGEAVSKGVGRHAPVYARRAGPLFHDAKDAPRGQAPAARVGEERPPRLAAHGEPAVNGMQGLVPHGDDTLLASLPHDPHRALPPVDVVSIEAAALGDPQPRGVEQLEDGTVTQAGPGALRPKIQKLLGLVLGKEGGQAFRELGAPDLPRGIQLHHAPPGKELEAAPNGGELPRDRALGELAVVQPGQPRANGPPI